MCSSHVFIAFILHRYLWSRHEDINSLECCWAICADKWTGTCVACMSYVWGSSIVPATMAFVPKLFHASHPYSANCSTFSLRLVSFSIKNCMFLPWVANDYVISLALVLFFLKCLYVKSCERAIWATSVYCVMLAFKCVRSCDANL